MNMSILGSGKIHNNRSNIVDLFSDRIRPVTSSKRFLRLSPEHDGLCMLYSSGKKSSNKLYTMKILCWGIRCNGDIEALVPWLRKMTPCSELDDPVYGSFEGYYNSSAQQVFYQAPAHKISELETAVKHADECVGNNDGDSVIQEIPDNIGTHALLNTGDESTFILTEVVSWQLLGNGHIEAMLVNDAMVETTPVLQGDTCLYRAAENPNFRYFFQYQIANQIKTGDPEAIAAIAVLFDQR